MVIFMHFLGNRSSKCTDTSARECFPIIIAQITLTLPPAHCVLRFRGGWLYWQLYTRNEFQVLIITSPVKYTSQIDKQNWSTLVSDLNTCDDLICQDFVNNRSSFVEDLTSFNYCAGDKQSTFWKDIF